MQAANVKTPLTALEDSERGELFRRARHLARVERALQSVLPVELRGHARLGRLTDTELRVQVDSPVWHTRLRYLLPQLLPHLNRLARTRLQSIDCVTRPFPAGVGARSDDKPKKGKGPLRPDASTARDLSQAARSIDDPDLSNALQRLADTLSNR